MTDTIAAIATGCARTAIGILRISGLKAREVAETVLGKLPKPRYADYLPFKDADGSVLDQGIALWFPGRKDPLAGAPSADVDLWSAP